MKLTDQQIETITSRAYQRWRVYNRGIRGQTISQHDQVEYWTVLETIKFINEPCVHCKGYGMVSHQRATTTQGQVCDYCHGNGRENVKQQ